ncbi:MAG: alpha-isopropylmalate synthase regulatory domain-containing protein, partial [Methylophilus sp.]
KGGIAYLLEAEYGIVMPRRLQVEFSRIVQQHTDTHGGEISADDIWQLFNHSYIDNAQMISYQQHHLFSEGDSQGIKLYVKNKGITHIITGVGNGPIDAAVHALQNLGINIKVQSYEEYAMSASKEAGNAQACAFIEIRDEQSATVCYGVGIDDSIVTASIKALLSGVNRKAMT